jgi:adenosylcobyric acid synthase
VINKFRGDVELLTPGIRMMEERVQKPCIGVVSYLHSLMLEEEDSLGLPAAMETTWAMEESANRPLRVAVLALPSF